MLQLLLCALAVSGLSVSPTQAEIVASENFVLDEMVPLAASGEMESENFVASVAAGETLAVTEAESELFTLESGIVSTRMTLTIDVKPGSSRNPINTKKAGVIPVAILSSATFDATTDLEFGSLTFGHSGDEQSLLLCSDEIADVNSDSLLDQMCYFKVGLTGFLPGDSVAVLKGSTIDAVTAIVATDSVDVKK
jgi:hypothetical protein